MATRFYFEVDSSKNTPNISPAFDASWEANAGNRRFMRTTRRGVLPATKTLSGTGVTGQDKAYLQLHSPPLRAQTIAGTLAGIIRVNESAIADNYAAAIVARVLSSDGATVRGTLLSEFGVGAAFPTASATRKFPSTGPAAVASVDAQEGDVIVIEFGLRQTSTSVANAGFVVGDGSADDFALTEGLTTNLNPWFEFSQDLDFQQQFAPESFYYSPLPSDVVYTPYGYAYFTLPAPLAATGGALTDVLLQALETDLAQALTQLKTAALPQALETDLAQAITARKAYPLPQASETDLAQAISSRKTKLLGQASETDLAQTIIRSGNSIPVGQALETDLAQALSARKTKTLGQALETDFAQPVRRVLEPALESDQAMQIRPLKTLVLAGASETELAQPLAGSAKVKLLGQATELELAQPITGIGGGAPLTSYERPRTGVGL